MLARELFIRHALVEGDWQTRHHFFGDNARLREEVEEIEERARRRDLVVGDDEIYAFYQADAAKDPLGEDSPFKTREDMLERIRQFAPLNQLDGAWVRNIARAGPIDDDCSHLLPSVAVSDLVEPLRSTVVPYSAV